MQLHEGGTKSFFFNVCQYTNKHFKLTELQLRTIDYNFVMCYYPKLNPN